MTHEGVKASTLSVLSIDFKLSLQDTPSIQHAENGLVANECYPCMPANAPAHPEYFALLKAHPNVTTSTPRFGAGPVPTSMRNGATPPFRLRRRDSSGLGLGGGNQAAYDVDAALEMFVDTSNSSRPVTLDERTAWEIEMSTVHQQLLDEEAARNKALLEKLGYVNCIGDSCATQVTLIKKASNSPVKNPKGGL